MKRFLALLLVFLMVLPLCGCSSSDYKKAVALYEAEDYEGAKALFDALGDYEDSAKYAADCAQVLDYGKALSLYDAGSYEEAALLFEALGEYQDSVKRAVDCRFLLDIAASILNRRDQNAKNTDFLTLTNTELAYLEKYRSASFFNSELKRLSTDYLAGLDQQKAALDLAKDTSDYQIEWQDGMMKRYRVLNDLYQNFGLLKDDMEFVATYVTNLQKEEDYLAALKAIDEDLHAQLDEYWFDGVDSYHFSAKYTNNTPYTFDVTVYFVFYTVDTSKVSPDDDFETLVANGTRVGESTNVFSAIRSGSENTLKFYQPIRNWHVCEFHWLISDIVYN